MRRITTIAATLTAAAVLLLSQVMAQTTEPQRKRHHFVRPTAPQTTLTPAQRAEVKSLNAVFAACQQKANAQNLAMKERRAFMKSCLRAR